MWQSHLDRFSLAKVQISVIPAQAGIHLLLPHCNDLLQNVTSKHLGLSRLLLPCMVEPCLQTVAGGLSPGSWRHE